MKLLAKKDLCQMFNCKDSTIKHLISTRQIPFIMIGKEARFKPESIEQWLDEREQKATFELIEGV